MYHQTHVFCRFSSNFCILRLTGKYFQIGAFDHLGGLRRKRINQTAFKIELAWYPECVTSATLRPNIQSLFRAGGCSDWTGFVNSMDSPWKSLFLLEDVIILASIQARSSDPIKLKCFWCSGCYLLDW